MGDEIVLSQRHGRPILEVPVSRGEGPFDLESHHPALLLPLLPPHVPLPPEHKYRTGRVLQDRTDHRLSTGIRNNAGGVYREPIY